MGKVIKMLLCPASYFIYSPFTALRDGLIPGLVSTISVSESDEPSAPLNLKTRTRRVCFVKASVAGVVLVWLEVTYSQQ